MTLIRYSRPTTLGEIDVRVDSIIALTLVMQSYSKSQPNLHAFDECFLELEAVLDLQNSAKQLLSTSSSLLTYHLQSLLRPKT